MTSFKLKKDASFCIFFQVLLITQLPSLTPSGIMLELNWPPLPQPIFQKSQQAFKALSSLPRLANGSKFQWRYLRNRIKIDKHCLTFPHLKFTIQEAWLNTLITAEIAFWFFVGECIGKGSIVGYKVWTCSHSSADLVCR